jgi:Helix-turn-helix domain
VQHTRDTAANANMLDAEAAASLLDVTTDTLAVWRSTKRYCLPYIKIGSKVRYREGDLMKWLETRTVGGK